MDIIFDIPVHRVTVTHNGAKETLLKLADGFWRVEDGNGLAQDTTNPLKEVLLNRDSSGVHQNVYIRIVDVPYSNPGVDSDGPSLAHDLYQAV